MKEAAERELSPNFYDQFARVGKALGNSHRLELLDLLAQGEYSVEDLAQASNISFASTSQHLKTLRSAGLVSRRRQKNKIIYRLSDPKVYKVSQAIFNLGTLSLPEINRIFLSLREGGRDSGMVSFSDVVKSLGNGSTTLLDVRSAKEYYSGHIPGAVSIPLAQLPKRIDEIPKDCKIVVYCRGEYCIFSDNALVTLREQGFQVRRMEKGFAEWRALGYPVNDCKDREVSVRYNKNIS